MHAMTRASRSKFASTHFSSRLNSSLNRDNELGSSKPHTHAVGFGRSVALRACAICGGSRGGALGLVGVVSDLPTSRDSSPRGHSQNGDFCKRRHHGAQVSHRFCDVVH